MKTLRTLTMTMMALALAAGVAAAQETAPPPPEAPDAQAPHRPFGPGPVMEALDGDGDGTISADEIAGAAEALRGLDEDGDGTLSLDEVRRDRGWFGRGARTGRAGVRGRAYAAPGRGAFGRAPRGRGFAPRAPMAPRGRMAPRVPAPGAGRFGGRAFGRGMGPGAFGRRAEPFGPGEIPEFVGERFFLRLDDDEDGSLTEDEVPEALWKRLAEIDGDGDGVVSREEMEAGVERRLDEMRETWRELRRRARPGTDQGQDQGQEQDQSE